ncbi:MAG: pyruvate dehydrogenase (acetyl-transferring) E1 component subunit alpha [Phycisphaeraceae bacterium]|nr:MAG: pyruvate dehydrogenase (acetyl-transferring) E1 component subunit alpha [Phycisphaeraceae bacterium]
MTQATSKPRNADTARLSDALPNETLLKWLYDMQLIREFEARTMQMYQQAKIGGFCHIYSGQEASAVGCTAAVNHDDPIVLAYRDHGHALARGMHPAACMAEMFGKLAGCAKGKGGSMHMFDKPNWLFGGHGIVSAQTPLGTGLAFACRYQWEVMETAKKRVCLTFLGDGAIDQGAFHEAQNLASVFGIPVIYIIENNGYSMGTAIHRHTANCDRLTMRGESYGIKSIEVDGLDIRNVYDQMKPLVDECRDLQRPGFVDLKTYRYQGHSMSDPQKYRTKDEVESFKERDSIANLAAHLMAQEDDGGRGCLTEDDWNTMQKDIRQIVMDAVAFAEQAADPDPEKELSTDTYALPMKNLSPSENYSHGTKNPLL